MISLSKPFISSEEKQAVLKVLESGHIVEGKEAQKLESLFSKTCKAKYAVAVNSGTAALHAALHAAGIGPGDEVITSPFTFVATANAILMQNASPVFADIDPVSFNINPDEVKRKITRNTKAILAVNLFGLPADYGSLRSIAKKYGLTLIEDAAQSINADYKNRKSGNLADISCFSLYATKNIMCGEGGIVTTNSARIRDRIMQFKNHGQPYGKRYTYKEVGFNYRLTDMQAAIAVVQMKRLEKITNRRREIASLYNKFLSDIEGLILPSSTKGTRHVYHQYTVRVNRSYGASRDALREHLTKNGVQSNIYYPIPLHKFPHFGALNQKFPEAEKAAARVLSLPVHPLLSDSDVKHVINAVKSHERHKKN